MTTQTVLHEGFLRKFSKGMLGSKWKKVYVRLYKDSSIFFFKNKGDPCSKGNTSLKNVCKFLTVGAYVRSIPHNPDLPSGGKIDHVIAFPQEPSKKSTIHFFLCDDDLHFDKWISSIMSTLPSVGAAPSIVQQAPGGPVVAAPSAPPAPGGPPPASGKHIPSPINTGGVGFEGLLASPPPCISPVPPPAYTPYPTHPLAGGYPPPPPSPNQLEGATFHQPPYQQQYYPQSNSYPIQPGSPYHQSPYPNQGYSPASFYNAQGPQPFQQTGFGAAYQGYGGDYGGGYNYQRRGSGNGSAGMGKMAAGFAAGAVSSTVGTHVTSKTVRGIGPWGWGTGSWGSGSWGSFGSFGSFGSGASFGSVGGGYDSD